MIAILLAESNRSWARDRGYLDASGELTDAGRAFLARWVAHLESKAGEP